MKSGAMARYAFDTGMAASEKQLTIDLGQKFRTATGWVALLKRSIALCGTGILPVLGFSILSERRNLASGSRTELYYGKR